ncbi:MAG: UbiA family prenyltransferase [Planctomycetes bacterium]|nr:UbiA family prenyltransferase [Planctomycetota bacterium]
MSLPTPTISTGSPLGHLSPPSPPTIDVVFVDLDQTLIASDISAEAIVSGLRHQPTALLGLIETSRRGLAPAKRYMYQLASIDVRNLPYRQEVIDYLRQARENGCRVVLATASDQLWANQVAEHLDLFDDVIGSDGTRNIKGPIKRDTLLKYCQERGYANFAYLGDSRADLAVWERAALAVTVTASDAVLGQLLTRATPVQILLPHRSSRPALIELLRPKQWIKNVLLFLPFLLAHQMGVLDKWLAAFWGALSFSLCASAAYVLNDAFDIEADRAHPRKRNRPLASGAYLVAKALPLAAGLLAVAFLIALVALPVSFAGMLVIYMILAAGYSFWLKRKVMIDVILLASLYTLRIIAGGEATSVPISEWLLALSLFLFTSLAFGKRYCELSQLGETTTTSARARGYSIGDLSLLEVLGPCSGYLAVLVLALYLQSDVVKVLYHHPRLLWLECPLLMYWISRFWILAKRQQLHDDPIAFALGDRTSLLVGALMAAVAVAASWGG